MNKEITRRKEVAVDASKKVGRILLDNFGRKLDVKSKGDRDLVTNIDKKCEKAVIDLIKKYFPEDGIISEESADVVSGNGFKWIIDPIDGTHNFIRNIQLVGCSCAVEFESNVVAGVIYMPCTDELYVAEKGKGAACNGKKISVSGKSLIEATLIYDSTIRYNKDRMLEILGFLADQSFNIRMFGSTVRGLTYVAEGKADVEIEFNDKSWDFASGLLLVEEAGGVATDFDGNPWSSATKGYIASNGIVHKDVLEVIKKGLKND